MELESVKFAHMSRFRDRQKIISCLSVVGILAGLGTGFYMFNETTSASRLTDKCLTSYSTQVGSIPFDAMKECAIR
jgi:hypothetical protein